MLGNNEWTFELEKGTLPNWRLFGGRQGSAQAGTPNTSE